VNIATFLLAKGRVETVEKVVTIYKQADSKDINKDSVNIVTKKEALPSYDEPGYLIKDEDNQPLNNKSVQRQGVPGSNVGSALDSSSSSQETAESSVEANDLEQLNLSGLSQGDDPIDVETDTPQLPLSDEDFEPYVDISDIGFLGVPDLPEGLDVN